jgi:hypothetical protein
VKTFENIAKSTTATLHFGGLVKDCIYFEEIEGFTLFALEK